MRTEDLQEPITVVLRLSPSGNDIIGTFASYKIVDDHMVYLIENPYIPVWNHEVEALTLIPYCILASETVYAFPAKTVQFISPATKHISDEYFKMLSANQIESAVDSPEMKKEKRLFKRAMKMYQTSPTTYTIQ